MSIQAGDKIPSVMLQVMGAEGPQDVTTDELFAGKKVVMLAVPNPGLILSPAAIYETIAEDTGVVTEMDLISEVLQYPANKSDTVHPNAQGYRMMAEGR